MNKANIMDSTKIMEFLEHIYNLTLKDGDKLKSAQTLASEYLNKYPDPEKAIDKLVQNHIALCATSGFVTNLGGIITIPIGVPANIASVLYLQMQMIAATACIRGYDPQDDQVRTFTYLCLTGSAMTETIKKIGFEIGEKIATNMIKSISSATLTKINQTIGFRLVTKFGTKGTINLCTLVPVAGGVISGGIDLLATKAIAHNAQKVFTAIPNTK